MANTVLRLNSDSDYVLTKISSNLFDIGSINANILSDGTLSISKFAVLPANRLLATDSSGNITTLN